MQGSIVEDFMAQPQKTICKAYKKDWPYWLGMVLFVLFYGWMRTGTSFVERINMDRVLVSRKEYFHTEMEEMKIRTKDHITAHRAIMVAEAKQDQAFFREELHKLGEDYKDTIVMIMRAQDEHDMEAEKFRISEEARAEKEKHHKQVEDMVQSEIDELDADIAKAKAQVAELENALKTHEGEELEQAVNDLKSRMASYEHTKARILALKPSANVGDKAELATLRTQTMPWLKKEIEELSTAIDAVVKAPNFAPEKPRDSLIKIVADAKNMLVGHSEL